MYSVLNAESESQSQSVEYMPCSSWSNEASVANEYLAVDASNTAAPCAVCLDVGSGFHYGVYTCEGCKVRMSVIGTKCPCRLFAVTVKHLITVLPQNQQNNLK